MFIEIFNKTVLNIKQHLKDMNLSVNIRLTCVIYKCNKIDGLLNALLCIKCGYDILILDFTNSCESYFNEYSNVKYLSMDVHNLFYEITNKCNLTIPFELKDISKNYENYCVIVAQLVNQFHGDFSLLTCGINRTRLYNGQQYKYGEKGDKNFISDISYIIVVKILNTFNIKLDDKYPDCEIYHTIPIYNIVDDISKTHHKVNYPIYFNTDYIDRYEDKYANKIKKESIISPPTEFPMTDNVSKILEIFRTKQGFYDECWDAIFVQNKIRKVIDYCTKVNRFNFYIAISGGIDSSVVYMILSRICKIDSRFKMTAITLPINSTAKIQSRAYELSKIEGREHYEIDSTDEHLKLCTFIYDEMTRLDLSPNPDKITYNFGCAKSNYRGFMMNLFASNNKGIIVGTGNEDEDAFLRFFSVYGDGFVDIDFVGDVPKFFMYRLAKYLNVPSNICSAVPSADLVIDDEDNNTDEGEIGSSYQFAELLLYTLKNPRLSEDIINSIDLNDEDYENLNDNLKKIIKCHNAFKHKTVKPQNVFNPEISDRFIDETRRITNNHIEDFSYDLTRSMKLFTNVTYIYFPGSFSIVTKSHCQIMVDAIKYMRKKVKGLIKVIIFPSSEHYNKEILKKISFKDRVKMCKNMVKCAYDMLGKNKSIEIKVSIIEESIPIYMGTYDLFNFYNCINNIKTFNVYILFGSDNIKSMVSTSKPWENRDELLNEYKFLVANRNDDVIINHKNFFNIPLSDQKNFSSSEVLTIKNSDLSSSEKEHLIKKIIIPNTYDIVVKNF